ncbi:MAG: TonB-dependent receptor family protein [Bacteroidota bacterium]
MTSMNTFQQLRRIVCLFLFLLSFPAVNSRHTGYGNYSGTGNGSGTLTGIVINSVTLKPVEYVYIILNKTTDSTLVTGGISDSLGKFKLEKVPFGNYYIAVNLIGHKPQKISDIVVTASDPVKKIDTIRLAPSSSMLDAVEIKEKKNAVEFSLDKKVINVEKALVSAGGSAVDVMLTIPSVTVDFDGNLSMRGSSNVTVLVDGKPSGLTGMSRSAILEQIPASSIESIEIISNPSAKYDPDGMTGIINIILKKKKERGYNGLFTINAGTGDKYSGSVALNYSKGKINLFANYDGRSNHSKGWSDFDRTTFLNDTVSYLQQDENSLRKRISHSFKLGTDFYINDKNTLTVSGLYGMNNSNDNEYSKSSEFDYNELITSYYENDNGEAGDENSMDYMLSYKRTFALKGESLTFDAIYSTSGETEESDQSWQYYLLDFITPSGMPVRQHNATDDKSSRSTFQADYVYPFNKNSQLEAGAKSIIRHIDNDYSFQNYSDSTGTWTDDSLLSNRFLYDEQLHSFYTTYSNTIGIFEFEAGLRAEQALTTSEQKTMDSVYEKNYFSLFPTLHLNLNLKNDNSFQLSYSRRVSRPSYYMLNPFVDASEPGFRHYGNPYLTPEYIDSYELGHLKYWDKTSLNSSLFYKQINDAIQRYVFIDSAGIQNITQQNISAGISYGLEFIFSQEIMKWGKVNTTFSYFRTIMEGSEEGEELTNSNYSWTAKINFMLFLPKNLDIQLTGNYRGPMAQLQGTMKAMYFADLALKKEIMNKKASITLRMSDIFNTQQFNMERSGSNFTIHMLRKRESRVVYLGFIYKMGKIKTKDKNKSYEGNEDFNGGED